MKCRFCGREIKSVQSIIRGAGHVCYCRDKEQLKLNFEGEKDGRAGKVSDSRDTGGRVCS